MPAKTLLTSFAFVSAMVLGGAAQAGPAISPDPEIATAKVSLADLDLRSEAGAAVGLRRIEMASEKVCGGQPDVRLIQRQASYKACVAVTMDRAVTSLGSPRVTALYTGTGHSLTLVSR
jgi:UrcA family protein